MKTLSKILFFSLLFFITHQNTWVINASQPAPQEPSQASKNLLRHVQSGSLVGVIEAFKNEADINVRNALGLTPLHIATQNKNNAFVKFLLKKKANVNHLARQNITALHIAALQGDAAIVELLLDNKAHTESKDHESFTPLLLATDKGHQAAVQLLLERKANVESKSNEGATCLHLATYHQHTDIVKLLLENKANVNVRDKKGFTPLHVAAAKNDHEIIAQLLLKNKAHVNSKDNNELTPLGLAIMESNATMIQLLSDHKATASLPNITKVITKANQHEEIKKTMPLITQALASKLSPKDTAVIEALEKAIGNNQQQLDLISSLLFIHYSIIEFYLAEQLLIQKNQTDDLHYVRKRINALLISECKAHTHLTPQVQEAWESFQDYLFRQWPEFNFKLVQALLIIQQEIFHDISSLSLNLDELNQNFHDMISEPSKYGIKKIKSLKDRKSHLHPKPENKKISWHSNEDYINYLLKNINVYEQIHTLCNQHLLQAPDCKILKKFIKKIDIFLKHGTKFASLHKLMEKNALFLQSTFIAIYEEATLFKTFYALCYHNLRQKLELPLPQAGQRDEKAKKIEAREDEELLYEMLENIHTLPDELWSINQMLMYQHADTQKICLLASKILQNHKLWFIDPHNEQLNAELSELIKQVEQLLSNKQIWGNCQLEYIGLRHNNFLKTPLEKTIFQAKAHYLINFLNNQSSSLSLQKQAPKKQVDSASSQQKRRQRKKKKQSTQLKSNKQKSFADAERKVEMKSVDEAQEAIEQLSLLSLDEQAAESKELSESDQSQDLTPAQTTPLQSQRKSLVWRQATDELYQYLFSSQERINLDSTSVAIRHYDKAKHEIMWTKFYDLSDEKKQAGESLKAQGYNLDLPKKDRFHCIPEAIFDYLQRGHKLTNDEELNQTLYALNQTLKSPFDFSQVLPEEEVYFLPAVIAPTFDGLNTEERGSGIHDGCYIFKFRNKQCLHAFFHQSQASCLRNKKGKGSKK